MGVRYSPAIRDGGEPGDAFGVPLRNSTIPTNPMIKRTTWKKWKNSGLVTAAAMALLPLSSTAQLTADYEYEPGEGYHQEEWYDVGDWFDGGGYEEMYSAGYDDPYYDSNYWETTGMSSWDGAWYDSYDYDPVDYGYYYWDSDANKWQRQQDQNRSEQAQRGQRKDQGDHKMAQRQQKKSEQRKADQQKKRPVQLSGKVDGFRRINIQNAKKDIHQHTFVKVTLKNGNKAIVDLGEKQGLATLDLEQGDSIKVRGKTAKIAGRTVVRASRIKVEGELTKLRKSANRVVKGMIKDTRQVEMKKGNDQHTFIRLEMQDGEEIIVDFGPGTKLRDMNLRKGDQVTIRGQVAKMDGKSILAARNVQVNEAQNQQG